MIKELEEIGENVKFFADLDSTGEAFRYPEDRDGNEILGEATITFDMDEVARSVRKISKGLEALHLGLDIELYKFDEMIELETEMRERYGDESNF